MADPTTPRRLRADAQRNLDALLAAAAAVFAEAGVDAPGQEIADRAGVGIGTMYRHFPQRSDLVAAVMASEIDACADRARELATTTPPWDALVSWIDALVELIGTKQGLAAALHADDPASNDLAGMVERRLGPPLEDLLDTARRAGAVATDLTAMEVVSAVSLLCQPLPGHGIAQNRRLIAVFVAGMRAAR